MQFHNYKMINKTSAGICMKNSVLVNDLALFDKIL